MKISSRLARRPLLLPHLHPLSISQHGPTSYTVFLKPLSLAAGLTCYYYAMGDSQRPLNRQCHSGTVDLGIVLTSYSLPSRCSCQWLLTASFNPASNFRFSESAPHRCSNHSNLKRGSTTRAYNWSNGSRLTSVDITLSCRYWIASSHMARKLTTEGRQETKGE